MTTEASIVNEALQMIASQQQVNALFDGSPAGDAAGAIYTPMLELLLRQIDPDFARTSVALTLAATSSPMPPFAYEYLYPADCVRARQVAPPPTGTGALADPYDPQPVRGQIAFDPNGGGVGKAAKVILSNQPNAWLSYTTGNVTEANFDAAFIEAFARRLGNPLAMALSGRPDFAREMLDESERFAGMAELSDEVADGMP